MAKETGLVASLANGMSAIFDQILSYLPNIVGAIALLVAGWLLARLLRVLTWRTAKLLDKVISRVVGPGAERLHMGNASKVLGTIVFWVVLLFFATAATEVLGLAPFTDWLSRFVAYLPTFVAGVLIMAAGYAVSRIVSDLVRTAALRFTPVQRAGLARVAQVTIISGSILVGADQIGIKVTFLVVFIAAIAAAIAGGLALSVGLGARDYVANLIGAHHLRETIQIGQVIRVGENEGRVVDVTSTALILESGNGRVSVPARVYNEQAITVITGNTNG